MKRQNKKGPLQFAQFSVIGAANAGICFGTLNLLLILFPADGNIMLVLYNTIAYTLAVVNSYFWNARITFRGAAKRSAWQRSAFIVQAILSLGISNLVFVGANFLLKTFEAPDWLRYNAAVGAAGLLSSLSSFFLIKYAVFYEFKRFDNNIKTRKVEENHEAFQEDYSPRR